MLKSRFGILLAIGSLLLSGWAPAAPARKPRIIHLVHRSTGFLPVDNPPAGDSMGDLFAFTEDVYDAENEHKLGTDDGYCVRTVVGQRWECNLTVFFEDGQITAQGPFPDSGDYVEVVTGGTGAYLGARGQAHLHTTGATTLDTLELLQ